MRSEKDGIGLLAKLELRNDGKIKMQIYKILMNE